MGACPLPLGKLKRHGLKSNGLKGRDLKGNGLLEILGGLEVRGFQNSRSKVGTPAASAEGETLRLRVTTT